MRPVTYIMKEALRNLLNSLLSSQKLNEVDNIDDIVKLLFDRGVITKVEKTIISNPCLDQVEQLINAVKRKNNAAFGEFVDSLSEAGHNDLATSLRLDSRTTVGPLITEKKTERTMNYTLLEPEITMDLLKTVPAQDDIKSEEPFYTKLCQMKQSNEYKIISVPKDCIYSDNHNKIRKFFIGVSNVLEIDEKVILLIGATGSGKTTLINNIVNYVFNINWEDNVRLKLIDEEPKIEEANQSVSQTSWVTAYTLHNQKEFRIPYTLTVIDTPGFGDTEGIARDEDITKQISQFFKTTGIAGIDHIDAVGFVVQSSTARLTPAQKYIFDSILTLFGNDIQENIFAIINFADSQTPPVLAALKAAKVPHKSYFKFNNSALYTFNDNTKNDQDLTFDKLYWNMGHNSFDLYLTDQLPQTKSNSLTLTKEVLEERKTLQNLVTIVQEDIQSGLLKLNDLEEEINTLQNHKADINRNNNFEITVLEEKFVKERTAGFKAMNCLNCKHTCHYPCGCRSKQLTKDLEKLCLIFQSGKCMICPESCSPEAHERDNYKFNLVREHKSKTAADIKAKYEKAYKEKLSAEQLIDKMIEELDALRAKITLQSEQVTQSLKKLHQIALRPINISAVEYIDMLIKGEKEAATSGWQRRIDQLEKVRQQAKYMKDLVEKGFDPFKPFMDKIQQEESKGISGAWSQLSRLMKKPFKWFWN